MSYTQAKVKAHIQALRKALRNFLRSRILRNVLIGGSALCLLLIVATVSAHAQNVAGNQSVEDTAQSLFQTFYTRWRWPICGLALIPAGWQWFSSDPRGRQRALSICAGILVWALIPYFIALFRVVTNS